MNAKQTFTTLLTLPVITSAFLASATLSPVVADECNAEKDLQGNVTKNEATVTNHSTNDACKYDATLAVYESPKEPETYHWIEEQKLIGSKSINVKAGETVTLKVDGTGSACWVQSDLFRGTEVLTPPVYRTAMDVDVYKVKDDCTKVEAASVERLAPTGDVLVVYSLILAGFATLIAGLFLRKAGK
jgi:hypothetical protein